MQIFQRRGLLISEDMVKSYLRKHIQSLWGISSKDDVKRFPKRKVKTENN